MTALAGTGRATPYIAAHVPGEIDKHLPRLPADYQVAERDVRRLLGAQILSALRVVDLEIRDHLSPQTRRILHVDPEMPKKYQGDPDDAPTMALAEFLGPCVIVCSHAVPCSVRSSRSWNEASGEQSSVVLGPALRYTRAPCTCRGSADKS